MKTFKVAWTELYGFEVNVEADTLEEAMEKVKDDPSLYSTVAFDGEYIDGTMEINLTVTQFMNDENGVKDEYR